MIRSKLQRGTGLRLHVVAIVLACSLGQVSALAHRALVRHVVCAEHGESLHLSSRNAPRAGVDASALAWRTMVGQGAPSLDTDGHEHCSLAGTRSATRQAQPVSAHAPELLLVDTGALRDDAPAPVVPRYLVAPKTSPPVLTS